MNTGTATEDTSLIGTEVNALNERDSNEDNAPQATPGQSSPIASSVPHQFSTTEGSIWSEVGVGEDGSITYNGPTSRFHAGPVADNDDASTPRRRLRQHDEPKSTPGQTESLKAQYELLDKVWIPLAKSKEMADFGISTDVAWNLLEIYWTWLHPLHNCVYRPVFIMDMALNGPYYSNFLLVAIFALASRHLSTQDGEGVNVHIREKLLSKAKMLLLDEMDQPKPRIPTIQGLLILGGCLSAMGKSSQGWLYTGMAIRMMQDIGLHLNINKIAKLEKLTPSEIEIRKRLYNSAFIWDKTLSLALGRLPSLLHTPYGDGDIVDHMDDTRPWCPSFAPDMGQSVYEPLPMYNTATFLAFCHLHEITIKMILLFHDNSPIDDMQPKASEIASEFCRWYEDLPQPLRMDDPKLMHQCPPPHIASLNFMYHALHILLQRPFLHSTRASVHDQSMAHCVSHSKMIHDIQLLYIQSFPYRLMTYQVSYCIYTAATIDVLEMKKSVSPCAEDAAMRLSTAIRTLQNEARHTPGSGRSLDTIRRQLSVWGNAPGMSTTRKRPRDGDIDENTATNVTTLPSGHSTRLHSSEPTDSSLRVLPDAGTDNWAAPFSTVGPSGMLNPLFPAFPDMNSGQSPAGDGVLNSGAGFHPEAFSWEVYDQL